MQSAELLQCHRRIIVKWQVVTDIMKPDEKDARIERGRKLRKAGLVDKPHVELFVVHSESGDRSYEVCHFRRWWLCTCHDFAVRGVQERNWYCKHIQAVRS